MNDVKRVIARPWAPPGKTAATVFEVLCRGWPVAGTAFYNVTACVCAVCLLKALVHVYTVSCAHTSDPVSLYTATTVYIISDCNWQWQTASVNFSDAA